MIYIIIVIAIAGSEYLIKNYMEAKLQKGDSQKILGGKIVLNKVLNRGAILNLLEEKKETVKTVSGVFLGLLLLLFTFMLPKKGNKLFKLGLALVLGGAISNVSDRFLRGYVVDYFSIKSDKWKRLNHIVFNLADIAIFAGGILVFISSAVSSLAGSILPGSAIFQGGSHKSSK